MADEQTAPGTTEGTTEGADVVDPDAEGNAEAETVAARRSVARGPGARSREARAPGSTAAVGSTPATEQQREAAAAATAPEDTTPAAAQVERKAVEATVPSDQSIVIGDTVAASLPVSGPREHFALLDPGGPSTHVAEVSPYAPEGAMAGYVRAPCDAHSISYPGGCSEPVFQVLWHRGQRIPADQFERWRSQQPDPDAEHLIPLSEPAPVAHELRADLTAGPIGTVLNSF